MTTKKILLSGFFILFFHMLLLSLPCQKESQAAPVLIRESAPYIWQGPWAGSVGDLNHDGIPDLVVAATFAPCGAAILLGKGNGEFSDAEYDYSIGGCPRAVDLGDLNQDGNLDAVMANPESDNIAVLLGNGEGIFEPAVNYTVGDGPSSVEVVTLAGDNIPDLIVANTLSDDISVLLGVGDGSFRQTQPIGTGNGPVMAKVADLNMDGVLDLAVTNGEMDSVAVHLSFGPPVHYTVGSQPSSMTIEDLDGDGRLDIAVSNQGSDNVSVLLGHGTGTFEAPVFYDTGHLPNAVQAADMDLDGVPDLVLTNMGTMEDPERLGCLSILPGNGDGTFQPAVQYGVPLWILMPSSFAVSDLDGDSDLDVVVMEPYVATSALVLINLIPNPFAWGPSATAEASAYRLRSQVSSGLLNTSLLFCIPAGMLLSIAWYRRKRKRRSLHASSSPF